MRQIVKTNINILVLFHRVEIPRKIKVEDSWKMTFSSNIIWSHMSHCCLSEVAAKKGEHNNNNAKI